MSGLRRRTETVAGVVAAVLTVPTVGVAATAWTDPAPLTGSLTAHTVAPPAAVSCTPGLLSATFSWPEVDARHDYRVVLRRLDTNAVTATRTVTGSATSAGFVGLTDVGLVVGLGQVPMRAEVTSLLAGSPTWTSSTSASRSFSVNAVVIGASLSC